MVTAERLGTAIQPEDKDPLTPPYVDMVFGAPVDDKNPLVEHLRDAIKIRDGIIEMQNDHLQKSNQVMVDAFKTNAALFLSYANISAMLVVNEALIHQGLNPTSVTLGIAVFTNVCLAEHNWNAAYEEEMFSSLPRKIYRRLRPTVGNNQPNLPK